MLTANPSNKRVTLEKACSWPVRMQSFAKTEHSWQLLTTCETQIMTDRVWQWSAFAITCMHASVEVDQEANADDDVDFWGRTDVWRSITDLDWHVSRSPPSNSTHRTPAQAIPHPIIVLMTDKDKYKHSHQTLYSSKSKVVISWWKNAARQLRQPSTEVQSGKNQVKFDTGVQMVRLLLSNTFQHCSSTANCKMEDLDN